MVKTNKRSAFCDAADDDLLTMQLGENDMPEYTNVGVGSNVLAISQIVRGGDPVSLADAILAKDDSVQEMVDLIVLVFVTRNTRGGKGEKDLSYKMFMRVWNKFPATAKVLLGLFAHYGYWKDYLRLMVLVSEDPSMKGLDMAAMNILRVQLQKDMASLAEYKLRIEKEDSRREGPKLSLLAKWLPREGSCFDKKVSFVERFAAIMWPELAKAKTDFRLDAIMWPELAKAKTDVRRKSTATKAEADEWKSTVKSKYRKTVSELTAYLELPEVLLSAQREDEINFQKVASKATLLLTKTFLNEDKEGNTRSNDPKRLRMSQMFIDQMLNKGLKGSALMPHEIVRKILYSTTISRAEELVLDAQWKDLWKTVMDRVKAKAEADGSDFDPTRLVPLSDVSGSMYGVPMEVSIALGIGISEITHEAFQNRVITFETKPRWHRLEPTDSIVKKVRSLAKAPWGGSTNFLGAYQLILDVVKRHKLSREDMPSLIVFSDMQFNEAAGCSGDAKSGMRDVQEEIKTKVAKVASDLGWEDTEPTPIVFWNLRNTGGHPVNKATEGTVLLSGFSPSLLKMVMNGEALREEEVEIVQSDGTSKTEKIRVTPEQVLRKMLNDSLYDPVRQVLTASTEGTLLEYNTLDKECHSLADEQAGEDESSFQLL